MVHRPAIHAVRPRATVTRHTSALGSWELAKARPADALRPLVRGYVGWTERLPTPLLRRELPTEEAPLVINFGAPFRLFTPGGWSRPIDLTSFITGAYDTYQLVESAGETHGVQVNFTLLGIRLLVGRPIEDMKNHALAPEDIFGAFARELAGRLYDARSWDARFEYLDVTLMARLERALDVPEFVRYAWQRLLTSSGRASITSIVREVGWSQRHFITQFKREIGVAPKILARMLRFGQAVRAIRASETSSLADVAVGAGYYDQSHLSRDAREFAGMTPGQLLRCALPDGGVGGA